MEIFTYTNVNLAREHINTVFQEYSCIFFTCHFVLHPNRNVHANALATSSAVNLVNHATETYKKKSWKQYKY